MATLTRDGNEFKVVVDGQVVFSGTMVEAMAKVAELTKAQLNAKPARRSGGKKLYR